MTAAPAASVAAVQKALAAWRESRQPGWYKDVGYQLQDVVCRHRYDLRQKGAKPDDPGWHPCSCGEWEGYWSDFEPHVADHLRAVAVAAADAAVEAATPGIQAGASEFRELMNRFAPRFWGRVDVQSDTACWPWTGPTVGYGHGRYDSPAGKVASRFAWALANGRLPRSDEVVRHRCDNPGCVNHRHLEIGSQLDNVQDMVSRGRAPWSDEACPKGHPRSEFLKIRSDGSRRCRQCDVDTSRAAYRPRFQCWCCPKALTLYNLKRHLEKVHGTTVTVTQIRDRADWIEADHE